MSSQTKENFAEDARRCLIRLQEAFRGLLGALSGPTQTAADVHRALGVDAKLGWQIHRIANSANPLNEVSQVPSAAGIRRVMAAGSQLGLDEALGEEIPKAYEELTDCIQKHASDQETFQRMVAALPAVDYPEAEQKAKRNAFESNSYLLGYCCECVTNCTIIGSFGNKPRLSIATVGCTMSYRTLRNREHGPAVATIEAGPNMPTQSLTQIVDRLYHHETPGKAAVILDQFSSKARPKLEPITIPDQGTVLRLSEQSIGNTGAFDLTICEVWSDYMRFPSPPPRPMYFGASVDVPTKAYYADLLIQHDALPTVPRVDAASLLGKNGYWGRFDINELEVLPVAERADVLGRGLSAFPATEAPRYVDAVRYTLETMGWGQQEFLHIRLKTDHPIYGCMLTTRLWFGSDE